MTTDRPRIIFGSPEAAAILEADRQLRAQEERRAALLAEHGENLFERADELRAEIAPMRREIASLEDILAQTEESLNEAVAELAIIDKLIADAGL